MSILHIWQVIYFHSYFKTTRLFGKTIELWLILKVQISLLQKRSHNRSCFRIICFGQPYVNQLFNTGCNPDHGQQVQNNNWRRKLRILLTSKSIPSRWRRREPVWWRHVTLKWCHVTHIVISYESAEIEPPHGPDNCLKVRTILNFRTLLRHFWLPDTVDFQDFL